MTVQQPVSSNVFLALDWKEVQSLLRGEGDMDVFLYDTSGRAHATVHLARSYFKDIERALVHLHANVLAREADRERLCEAETYLEEDLGPIIIVD